VFLSLAMHQLAPALARAVPMLDDWMPAGRTQCARPTSRVENLA
jgi:hypothetical protein